MKVVGYAQAHMFIGGEINVCSIRPKKVDWADQNIKLTFDSETRELEAVELITKEPK
jgi:hypothetical protein